MTEKKAGKVGIFNPEELPGRRIRKGELLMLLAEVQEFVKRVREGVPVGKVICIILDAQTMQELKITTPGRILQEQVETMIKNENLKSQDGQELSVKKYKATDGNDVVFVAEASVTVYVRTSSKRRTEKRRQEGE